VQIVSDNFLETDLDENSIIRFPSDKRWLTGDEYAFLLRHHKLYTELYKDKFLTGEKRHPECIYD
jgi:hypothetical protein